MTRAMRERLANGGRQGINDYAYATVRVRLPEGLVLQGEFNAGAACQFSTMYFSPIVHGAALQRPFASVPAALDMPGQCCPQHLLSSTQPTTAVFASACSAVE